MVRVLTLLGVLVASSSVIAQQSPTLARCGVYGPDTTKIHGCLDYPSNFSTVTASYNLILAGWAVNTETLQQPADVAVFQRSDELDAHGNPTIEELSRDDYKVYWRLQRPDVLAWASSVSAIRSESLGYAIVIKAGVIRLGHNIITVQFTDPTALNPVGVNHQQLQVYVEQ